MHPLSFQIKNFFSFIPCVPHISHIAFFFYSVTLTTLDTDYKSYNFLHSFLILCLWYVFPNTLFSNTVSLCSSYRATGYASHSNKTTSTIVRFEVFVVVRMMMLLFSPEDGGSMFLQNVGIYQQVCMVLKPWRTASSRTTIIVLYILMFMVLDRTWKDKDSELNKSQHSPNSICS
jgi:hypothetical protein